MEERSPQEKELPGKGIVGWTFECMQRLKRGEMEAYTLELGEVYILSRHVYTHTHTQIFLSTEKIWIIITNS